MCDGEEANIVDEGGRRPLKVANAIDLVACSYTLALRLGLLVEALYDLLFMSLCSHCQNLLGFL